MADKDELLEQHTKEELLEKAGEQDLTGRHSMNKEELAAALADGSSSDGTTDGNTPAHDLEASDPHSESVQEGLSPEGKDALDAVGEDSEYAAKSDLALDASGPLHFEDPASRVMTGAVSEKHAKEQKKALKNKPKDYVGDVTEAGFDGDGAVKTTSTAKFQESEKDNLSENDDRKLTEVRDTDVIDFPPPVGQREFDGEVKDGETISAPPSGAGFGTQVSPGNVDNHNTGKRGFEQKSVFYTDGLSGGAEHNLERAYETPEILQSNNPVVRQAGDESISEAAQDDRSDRDKRVAKEVIERDDDPSQVTRNAE